MLFKEAKEILNVNGYRLLDEAGTTPDTVDLWGMKEVNKEDYTPTMWSRIISNKRLTDEWIKNPTLKNNPDFYVRTLIKTVNTRRDRTWAWKTNDSEVRIKLGIPDMKKELYALEKKCRKEYREKCSEMDKKVADKLGLIMTQTKWSGTYLDYDDPELRDSYIYFTPVYKINYISEFEWEPVLIYLNRHGYIALSQDTIKNRAGDEVKVPCWDIPEDDPKYNKSAWKNTQIKPTKETVDEIYEWIQANKDIVMEHADYNKRTEQAMLDDQRKYYADHPNGNWSGD